MFHFQTEVLKSTEIMAPTLRSQSNENSEKPKTKIDNETKANRSRTTKTQSKRERIDGSAPLLTKEIQIILKQLSLEKLKQHGIEEQK